MRKLIVDYFRLPWDLDVALTCSKTDEVELTDDWVIIKKSEYESLKKEPPYYMSKEFENDTFSN